ncbi:PepSY-associated TM helix domain-containing protein [Nitrosomonas marina]|uniref:Uncharacterized iron-regulated membrane protein n=1 Tax=Nitrosomonas marina TaxID=917 RepID=A0A1H8C5M1_9PROT|nr:PepSY-associated TM helix domain-containing protein [Nitrosomonas marina]SEM90272.1 Uncharacterized iron-regulated membrane protein [Nitrosomonas marina]
MRRLLTIVHRYTGLLLAPFLLIVGLTGSVLAFYHELDRWLNPSMLTVPVPQSSSVLPFDPFALHERAENQTPHAQVDWFDLTFEPGQAYRLFLLPRINPHSGLPYDLPYNEIYFNPYTGEQTGARTWGEVSLAKENILSFLYRLHYALALPEHLAMFGMTILGVIALLWFLDSFVGFYLTVPQQRMKQSLPYKQYWQRWKPAWHIKPSRFNYDLHRACGLWLWPVLLALAWSGVAFNLKEVYQPVMSSVLNMRDLDALPRLDKPLKTPGLDWRAAHQFGHEYIQRASEEYGFVVERELSLFLDRVHGVYHYRVKTDHDYGKNGATIVVLNAGTGKLVTLTTPVTDSIGDVVHRWITWLHTARVFGLPIQILICMAGLIVAILSVTGTVIWSRKHRIQKAKVITWESVALLREQRLASLRSVLHHSQK